MNILLIHPHDIYSHLEPWTTRITNIGLELHKLGHQVKLIYSIRDPLQLQFAYFRQEYPFHVIPMIRYSFTLIKKIKLMQSFVQWADIVHFQKCFPWTSLPALFTAYRAQKPIHYDWDDWEYMIYTVCGQTKLVGNYIRHLERALPRYVDTITVASEALRRLCIENGFPAERIFDGHVGADIVKFNPGVDGSLIKHKFGIDGKLVLYLGQLSGAQYAELFLLAAKQLLEKHADISFMVVGGGDQLDTLIRFSHGIGLKDKVIFTNAINQDMVPAYLAAADIAVACFKDDVQQRTKSPLKIAEYMASGKAIVASRVGEVPRMVGDAGILVDPGSPEALVQGIETYLANPDRIVEDGKKARIRAETEFNWAVTARTLVNAYELAMSLYR